LAVGKGFLLKKSAWFTSLGFVGAGFGFGFVIGFGFGGVTLIGGLGLGLGFTTGLGFGCSTAGFGFGLTTGGLGVGLTAGAGLGETCARFAEGGGVETN
jgi:hypothetical protein